MAEPIEKMLGRQSGRFLTYDRRFQLVKWIVAGKLSYCSHGTTLLISVINKVHKFAYSIWDDWMRGNKFLGSKCHTQVPRQKKAWE